VPLSKLLPQQSQLNTVLNCTSLVGWPLTDTICLCLPHECYLQFKISSTPDYYHYYYANNFSRLLTLTTPTISNTEAAMQQIIITYMKNLSSADQNNTANINSQNSAVKEIISLNLSITVSMKFMSSTPFIIKTYK